MVQNLIFLRDRAANASRVVAPRNLATGMRVTLPDGRGVALCRPIMHLDDGSDLWMAQEVDKRDAFVWVRVAIE